MSGEGDTDCIFWLVLDAFSCVTRLIQRSHRMGDHRSNFFTALTYISKSNSKLYVLKNNYVQSLPIDVTSFSKQPLLQTHFTKGTWWNEHALLLFNVNAALFGLFYLCFVGISQIICCTLPPRVAEICTYLIILITVLKSGCFIVGLGYNVDTYVTAGYPEIPRDTQKCSNSRSVSDQLTTQEADNEITRYWIHVYRYYLSK